MVRKCLRLNHKRVRGPSLNTRSLLRLIGYAEDNKSLPDNKKPDRRTVFFIISQVVNGWHDSKLLDYTHSRGIYFFSERSRGENQVYFYTRIRGNYITTTRVRYLDGSGVGVNLFSSVLIPAMIDGDSSIASSLKEDREVILKVPLSEWAKFYDLYKFATPELGWYDPPEDYPYLDSSYGDEEAEENFGDKD